MSQIFFSITMNENGVIIIKSMYVKQQWVQENPLRKNLKK